MPPLKHDAAVKDPPVDTRQNMQAKETAEKSFPERVLRSLAQFVGGSSIQTVAGFVASYFNARLLGPALLGTWSTAQIFMSYRIFFSLSLPFVMRRDFTMLRGEGREKEAWEIAYQVFSYGIVVTPFLSLALAGYAFFFVENYWFRISLFVASGIFLVEMFSGFGNILSKGVNNYAIIAQASVIQAVVVLFSIPGVYLWGFKALLVGQACAAVAIAVLYYVKKPVKYGWHWDWKLLKRLTVAALPLYLADISAAAFSSIDRIIIAGALSFEDVGLYALSNIVATPLNLLISSAGIVIFTHLNERHGTSKEKAVVLKHMNAPQSIFGWLAPPFIGLGIIILPVIIPLVLPEYVEGVRAAQISVIGVYFYALTNFSANALFILDKQKNSAICFVIAGIFNTFGSFLFVRIGYGIEGVAIATSTGFFIYNALMMCFVYRFTGESVKTFFMTFLDRVAPALGVFTFSFLLVEAPNVLFGNYFPVGSWTLVTASSLMYLLLTVPIAWKGYSRLRMYV